MRIFTCCLGTETHTGAALPTDLKAFEDTYLVRGGAHPEGKVNMFGVPLVMWRERAEARGWEVAESVCAFATPSGMVVKRVYEDLRDEILRDVEAAMPVDAVMLSLHGAMVVEGSGAAEGDLVQRIRDVVGPDVPMMAEFDLHCHLSKGLCDNLAALVIYKEYPHTDFAARAEEVWTLMAGLLDQYHFASNLQAYQLVQKMAGWVHDRVEAVISGPGGEALWQRVLLTEWGGMNDVRYP